MTTSPGLATRWLSSARIALRCSSEVNGRKSGEVCTKLARSRRRARALGRRGGRAFEGEHFAGAVDERRPGGSEERRGEIGDLDVFGRRRRRRASLGARARPRVDFGERGAEPLFFRRELEGELQ